MLDDWLHRQKQHKQFMGPHHLMSLYIYFIWAIKVLSPQISQTSYCGYYFLRNWSRGWGRSIEQLVNMIERQQKSPQIAGFE